MTSYAQGRAVPIVGIDSNVGRRPSWGGVGGDMKATNSLTWQTGGTAAIVILQVHTHSRFSGDLPPHGVQCLGGKSTSRLCRGNARVCILRRILFQLRQQGSGNATHCVSGMSGVKLMSRHAANATHTTKRRISLWLGGGEGRGEEGEGNKRKWKQRTTNGTMAGRPSQQHIKQVGTTSRQARSRCKKRRWKGLWQ